MGHRALVLGVCASVGGCAGSIRAVLDGAGVLEILALAGIGVAGLILAVACVVEYSRR